jgi:hypothetical protein
MQIREIHESFRSLQPGMKLTSAIVTVSENLFEIVHLIFLICRNLHADPREGFICSSRDGSAMFRQFLRRMRW